MESVESFVRRCEECAGVTFSAIPDEPQAEWGWQILCRRGDTLLIGRLSGQQDDTTGCDLIDAYAVIGRSADLPQADPDASAVNAVRAALAATQADYLAKCAALRSAESAEGSRYAMDATGVLDAVRHALDWVETPHPEVRAPARAFVSRSLTGIVGVVPLKALAMGTLVSLSDPKDTGVVEALVTEGDAPPGSLDDVRPTWLIVGPHDGREIVYTWHPGEPIVPSAIPAHGRNNTIVSARKALELGLTHAKITG